MSDGAITKTIRVGICDDSVDTRRQLEVYLSVAPDLVIAGRYEFGMAAIAGVPHDDIHVLLLDVRMPGMPGPMVAEKLAAAGATCKVLYLTSYPDEIPVDRALRGIVRGALTKDITPENLVSAIRLVASGVSLLGPEFDRPPADTAPAASGWVPNAREMEVLSMLRQGASNAQIAEEMFMSISWVKRTIAAMCQQAGVRTRAGLAAWTGRPSRRP